MLYKSRRVTNENTFVFMKNDSKISAQVFNFYAHSFGTYDANEMGFFFFFFNFYDHADSDFEFAQWSGNLNFQSCKQKLKCTVPAVIVRQSVYVFNTELKNREFFPLVFKRNLPFFQRSSTPYLTYGKNTEKNKPYSSKCSGLTLKENINWFLRVGGFDRFFRWVI